MTKTIQLSDSSCKTLNGCARDFQIYKFFQHAANNRQENFHGDVGICIHKGYQEWLRSGNLDLSLFEMAANYPYNSFDESNQNHRTKSLEACVPTIEKMATNIDLSTYEIANIDCLDGVRRPAIEVPFRIDLPALSTNELSFNYVGYMDAILWNKITHEYTVVDIKTHRSKTQDRTAEYIYKSQDIPYGIVLQYILQERLDKFNAIYIDVYIDIEEPRVFPYEFERTPEDVADWIKGLHVDINLIKLYHSMNWWKRNGNHCMNFNSKCRFLDACSIRDDEQLQKYLLGGQEPEESHVVEPWIQFSLEE